MNYPVYESKAKYDMWLKVLLGGVVALTFVIGLSEVVWGGEEALTVFGTVLFEIVLYWLIMPRRFQITSDKLRIVLGGPLAFNIAPSEIEEARSRTGTAAFIYFGTRFATSASHTVEIVRGRGRNMVISPSDDEEFIK
jgi:hypothetical protein